MTRVLSVLSIRLNSQRLSRIPMQLHVHTSVS